MEQTKICTECGQEKPISEFNKNKGSKDGHQSRCRSCFSKYNKARYHADPSRFISDVRKYREENKENLFETRMRMCEKNPNHKNANMALDLALKLGYVEKPDHCLGCGCPAEESRVTAHHHDYSKPLEVVWVCSSCHRFLDANRRVREGKNPYGAGRRVAMMRGGEVLCRFDTIIDAARAVDRGASSISQCLAGKSRTCAGFEWRYEEGRNAKTEDG